MEVFLSRTATPVDHEMPVGRWNPLPGGEKAARPGVGGGFESVTHPVWLRGGGRRASHASEEGIFSAARCLSLKKGDKHPNGTTNLFADVGRSTLGV